MFMFVFADLNEHAFVHLPTLLTVQTIELVPNFTIVESHLSSDHKKKLKRNHKINVRLLVHSVQNEVEWKF